MPKAEFEAIGTHWYIEVYDAVPEARWQTLLTDIHARIEQFDANYSRFRSDSLVSRMAVTAGEYTLPPDAEPLLTLYEELYAHTAGAMTPLIGQPLSEAGYDAKYSFAERPVSQPPVWNDVLDYAFPKLTLARPALLDVGAAGKGYLVDLVATLLRAAGIAGFCVDAGGDLTYESAGRPALRVGLEHPADPSQVIGVAELTGGSLCGSAGNRRAWGNYHHILDPRTLASPRHLQAVWVAANTTLLADALTTALYFVAPARLSTYYKFTYCLVHSNGTLEYSPGFPATLFS